MRERVKTAEYNNKFPELYWSHPYLYPCINPTALTGCIALFQWAKLSQGHPLTRITKTFIKSVYP